MTVVEHEIRLLILTCGACGGQVVGDNTGDGRAWQHLTGPEDHHVVFGTPAPPGHLSEAPAALDALEALLEEEESDLTAGLPPPGTPREAHDDELGGPKSGTRQMVNTALRAGFTVTARLCVGPVKIGRQHDPRGYRYTASLLVGFKHTDGRAAVAIWERLTETEGAPTKFVLAFVKGQGMTSSPDLRTYLKSAP